MVLFTAMTSSSTTEVIMERLQINLTYVRFKGWQIFNCNDREDGYTFIAVEMAEVRCVNLDRMIAKLYPLVSISNQRKVAGLNYVIDLYKYGSLVIIYSSTSYLILFTVVVVISKREGKHEDGVNKTFELLLDEMKLHKRSK